MAPDVKPTLEYGSQRDPDALQTLKDAKNYLRHNYEDVCRKVSPGAAAAAQLAPVSPDYRFEFLMPANEKGFTSTTPVIVACKHGLTWHAVIKHQSADWALNQLREFHHLHEKVATFCWFAWCTVYLINHCSISCTPNNARARTHTHTHTHTHARTHAHAPHLPSSWRLAMMKTKMKLSKFCEWMHTS